MLVIKGDEHTVLIVHMDKSLGTLSIPSLPVGNVVGDGFLVEPKPGSTFLFGIQTDFIVSWGSSDRDVD